MALRLSKNRSYILYSVQYVVLTVDIDKKEAGGEEYKIL
jgi:hypothetical protein